MGKKYRNLIDRVVSDENMREAYRLTSRGKRLTPGYLEFKEFSALNLAQLAEDMRRGEYLQGEPHEFQIFDPKLRTITALPFRDRVAQHALCGVIGPIFDRSLLPNTFACRPGKGTHAGVVALQSDLRRLTRDGQPLYFLKTDFSRFFASIQRPALWRLVERKISCAATLDVLERILPRDGVGLPIGSLTSQICANLYGSLVDRHLQQECREPFWYRYMDDLVVLGTSSERLKEIKDSVERIAADELGLRFSKWQIAPVSRGINFLGYRVWTTHKLLRRQSVVRAKHKIAAYRDAGDNERLSKFLGAWTGHAGWADCHNLMISLGLEPSDPTPIRRAGRSPITAARAKRVQITRQELPARATTFHDDALSKLKSVKTDATLSAWHDRFMAGDDYLNANPEVVADLEAAYRDKLMHLWGVGG